MTESVSSDCSYSLWRDSYHGTKTIRRKEELKLLVYPRVRNIKESSQLLLYDRGCVNKEKVEEKIY